jgi:hypothetical protein
VTNKESDGAQRATTSMTKQVDSRGVVPCEPQTISSRNLNVTHLIPPPQSWATTGKGPKYTKFEKETF